MYRFPIFLAICLLSATALPQQERIAGGTLATPGLHPYGAAIFFANDVTNFHLICAGAILNNRTVLTASSCWIGAFVNQLRIRVGSIYPTSGGSLHNVNTLLAHPTYTEWNRNNNLGVIRVTTTFPLGNNVQPIVIAAANHVLADNQDVTTIGWGRRSVDGQLHNKLHSVVLRTVNQVTCQNIYGLNFLTATMLCAGWTQDPRGPCEGDMGAPLVHGNFLVGITSFIVGCGDTPFPAIYTRISRYTAWIQTNA